MCTHTTGDRNIIEVYTESMMLEGETYYAWGGGGGGDSRCPLLCRYMKPHGNTLSDIVLVSVEALPSHLDHPPGEQSSEHNSQYSPYTEGVTTLSQGNLYLCCNTANNY